jgi:hypothetical protein
MQLRENWPSARHFLLRAMLEAVKKSYNRPKKFFLSPRANTARHESRRSRIVFRPTDPIRAQPA